MSSTLDILEEKIRELLERMDRLEAENSSFRALINGGGDKLSIEQVVEEIKSLKVEKEKLARKIEFVEQGLDQVIKELDKVDL